MLADSSIIEAIRVWLQLHGEELKVVTPITSMIVAVLALVMSLRTERRAHRRFIMSNTPKLVFDVSFDAFSNEVSIINQGLGLAIVRNVQAFRDHKEYAHEHQNRSKSLFELFNFPNGCTWRQCKVFWRQEYYIRPGERIECAVLGFSELVELFKNEDNAREVFNLYPDELSKMKMIVSYSDVTGKNSFLLEMDFGRYQTKREAKALSISPDVASVVPARSPARPPSPAA